MNEPYSSTPSVLLLPAGSPSAMPLTAGKYVVGALFGDPPTHPPNKGFGTAVSAGHAVDHCLQLSFTSSAALYTDECVQQYPNSECFLIRALPSVVDMASTDTVYSVLTPPTHPPDVHVRRRKQALHGASEQLPKCGIGRDIAHHCHCKPHVYV